MLFAIGPTAICAATVEDLEPADVAEMIVADIGRKHKELVKANIDYPIYGSDPNRRVWRPPSEISLRSHAAILRYHSGTPRFHHSP